jgi:hypothetical protein
MPSNLWRFFSQLPHLLIHADPFRPFILETDVYHFAISITFSQLGEDNLFHPINFQFHKFSFVEINYEIHDNELLAIMDAFEEYVIYLKELNMKSSCIQIIRTSSISCLLELWIDAKFVRHYPCFDFGSSSHTILGIIKGNQMYYFAIRTLRLRREVKLIINNVMSSSSLNTFDFKHYLWFLMTNPFLFSFVKSCWKIFLPILMNTIEKFKSNLRPLWQIWVSWWFVIL